MRKALLWGGLAFLLKPGVAQIPPSRQGCDRECRSGMLTRDLNAVVAHGQIHAMEAFMHSAPRGAGFGWDL